MLQNKTSGLSERGGGLSLTGGGLARGGGLPSAKGTGMDVGQVYNKWAQGEIDEIEEDKQAIGREYEDYLVYKSQIREGNPQKTPQKQLSFGSEPATEMKGVHDGKTVQAPKVSKVMEKVLQGTKPVFENKTRINATERSIKEGAEFVKRADSRKASRAEKPTRVSERGNVFLLPSAGEQEENPLTKTLMAVLSSPMKMVTHSPVGKYLLSPKVKEI
mgnify:CR=1 FL=1